jgi:hypothetical protein
MALVTTIKMKFALVCIESQINHKILFIDLPFSAALLIGQAKLFWVGSTLGLTQ